MRRFITCAALSILLAVSISPAAAMAKHTRAHHAAVRLCKQNYRNAVRGAKYLRGRERRARIAQARKERAECIALAPK